MRRNFDVLNRVKVDGLPSYCSMRDSQFILIRLRVELVRWCGLGVTTDYLVVPVLNWTKLGCNKRFCLLVSIELQLFYVCPGGWTIVCWRLPGPNF